MRKSYKNMGHSKDKKRQGLQHRIQNGIGRGHTLLAARQMVPPGQASQQAREVGGENTAPRRLSRNVRKEGRRTRPPKWQAIVWRNASSNTQMVNRLPTILEADKRAGDPGLWHLSAVASTVAYHEVATSIAREEKGQVGGRIPMQTKGLGYRMFACLKIL